MRERVWQCWHLCCFCWSSVYDVWGRCDHTWSVDHLMLSWLPWLYTRNTRDNEDNTLEIECRYDRECSDSDTSSLLSDVYLRKQQTRSMRLAHCKPFDPYNAELLFHKTWRTKGFIQFEIIINVLFSSFCFICIPMFMSNVMSKAIIIYFLIRSVRGSTLDVRFWRLNPLTAGAAYIRVFIFISTLSTTY